MDALKPKIIVVVGPTASGKSGLAIALAKKYQGEIISADSRQIYKKLDIGTAKVTKEEMAGVPHHLIDIIDIDDTYSAIDFKKDARRIIAEIIARGNTPIIAGGTFFYVDALLGKVSAPEVLPNHALREKLEVMDVDSLYNALLKVDERRAATIDPKNKRRLVRALEIVEALGMVPEQAPENLAYTALVLGIKTDKEELRGRMRDRAIVWLKNGFIEEIQGLLDSGITRERLAEIGFEYQLGLDYIDGTLSEEAFIQSFEEKNWQYAKRQITWLKRDKSIHWVFLSEQRETDLMVSNFLIN